MKHIIHLSRGILVALGLMIILINGKSQSLAFDLFNGERKISVPFEFNMGYIIVDLKFHNSVPLKFIFDTGSENTILFQREISDILHIDYVKKVKVRGADLKNDINAFICRDVFLEVEELPNVKRDIVVLEKDILELDKVTGIPINGILGTSFFKGLILRIDYRHRQLVLYDSRIFDEKVLKNHEELLIEMKQSKSYIKCAVEMQKGNVQFLNLLLDTGAGISMLLYDNPQVNHKDELIPSGKMGVVISGSLLGYMGRAYRLNIGGFRFDNLICNLIQKDSLINVELLKTNREGLIGNAILSRFDIIIDYFNGRLFMQPYKYYNKEFEYDKSGLDLYAVGPQLEEYLVNSIVKNSPAYFCGIKKGDRIIKINGLRASNKGLEGFNRVFSKSIGTLITLKIRRDGIDIIKKFQLFDYLESVDHNMKYIWWTPQRMNFF